MFDVILPYTREVVALAVTYMFLKFIAHERKEDRLVWENHLSRMAIAVEKSITLLELLTEEVRDLRRQRSSEIQRSSPSNES